MPLPKVLSQVCDRPVAELAGGHVIDPHRLANRTIIHSSPIREEEHASMSHGELLEGRCDVGVEFGTRFMSDVRLGRVDP